MSSDVRGRVAWGVGIVVIAVLSLPAQETFVRGDVGGDGVVDAADAALLAAYLFEGAPFPGPIDRADVNDNEVITIADLVYLRHWLGCAGTAPLPEPRTEGVDPDDDTRGFETADPRYRLSAAAEVLARGVQVRLQAWVSGGTAVKAATVILRYDPALAPRARAFCPAGGVVLENVRTEGGRVILSLRGGECGGLPSPDPTTGLLDLGVARFDHDGSVRCTHGLVVLESEYMGGDGVSRRATVVDAVYADHQPYLEVMRCVESNDDFLRGDANGDGVVDIADAVWSLSFLFSGGGADCLDALDANDDGAVDIADPIATLSYLFGGGPPPPAPFGEGVCGEDPTEDGPCVELGCRRGCAARDVGTSPWPMFRGNRRHTALSPYTGPPAPTVAWTFQAGDGIVSSPAIGADGTVYFGAGWYWRGAEDRHLYALNPNGTLKWSYEGGDGFFASPALGPRGMLYLSSLDGGLYAIEDRHTHAALKWRLHLGYFFSLSSPAIGADGTIYVGSPDFRIYAVHPDGTVRWFHTSQWCVISSPAIGDDGTVYVGSKDQHLYAFRPEGGGPLWAFGIGRFYDGYLVDSSPAIGADGTIYFGTDPYGAAGRTPVPTTTNFWAVHPDGTKKWSFETEDGVESSPAIGPDGTLYFGSYDGYLYAVTDAGTEGALKWKFKTRDAIDGSPAVDADGVIYIGSRDGTLYALRPDGTVKWTLETSGGFACSPSIDGRGYLYIGNFAGTFYAIGTGRPDVGVASVDMPARVAAGTSAVPAVTVRNYRAAATGMDVTCTIAHEGTVVYADTQAVFAAGGAAVAVTFAPWNVPAGTGRVYTVTVLAQHAGDENPDNDARTIEVTS